MTGKRKRWYSNWFPLTGIEVLVVVLILGILAAITIPIVIGYNESQSGTSVPF